MNHFQKLKEIKNEIISISQIVNEEFVKISENSNFITITFSKVTSLNRLNQLSNIKHFNIMGSNNRSPHAMLARPERFPDSDVINLKFNASYNKDEFQSLTYYFFTHDNAIEFIKKNTTEKITEKVSIGLFNIKSFSTPFYNFIDIENYSSNQISLKVDNLFNQKMKLIKKTDDSSSEVNNLFSFYIEIYNDTCGFQEKMVREYYRNFFRIFSYKVEDNVYHIRGKKKITITENDDFSISNYKFFDSLINFLFKDEKFIEKYTIVKNVITRYIHESDDFTIMNSKVIEIYKTSRHYFEKYIQEDLDSFFQSRDAIYKESISASKSIMEQNDKINNYINASLASLLILIITYIVRTLGSGAGPTKELLVYFFFSILVASTIFSYQIYRIANNGVNTTYNQFIFFIKKMAIFIEDEQEELMETYILGPIHSLFNSLIFINSLILVFNMIFIYFLRDGLVTLKSSDSPLLILILISCLLIQIYLLIYINIRKCNLHKQKVLD